MSGYGDAKLPTLAYTIACRDRAPKYNYYEYGYDEGMWDHISG